MSLFITFEGCEGSGKSHQSKVLYEYIKSLSLPVILTQEPGGTAIGDEITRLLKWTKADSISPLTELMLFNASRAQLVRNVIEPALKEGKIVICDRYTDSTVAYQGYGRGLELELVNTVNSIATGGIVPDITVFLDVCPTISFDRMHGTADRIENEEKDFHERVYKGFRSIGEKAAGRWFTVDASESKEKVSQIIREKIDTILKDFGV